MLARITGLLKKAFFNRMRKANLFQSKIMVGPHPGFLVPVELHPNQPSPNTEWGEGSVVRFTILGDQMGPQWEDYRSLGNQKFYVHLINSGNILKYKGKILQNSLSVNTDDYLGIELNFEIEEVLGYQHISKEVIDKSHMIITLLSVSVAIAVPSLTAVITGSNAMGVACGIAILQLYAGICRQIIVLSERDNAGQYKPVSFWLFNFLLRNNVPRQPVGNLYERDWRGLVTLLRGASYFMGAGLLLALIAQNGGGALLGRLLPGG